MTKNAFVLFVLSRRLFPLYPGNHFPNQLSPISSLSDLVTSPFTHRTDQSSPHCLFALATSSVVTSLPREQQSPAMSWPYPAVPTTCFTASRLTPTVFKIVEDDIYSERPFIYVKLYPTIVLLLDTGCGGAARDQTVQLKSLRQFIEQWPVPDNGDRALNATRKPYIVVESHLHYVSRSLRSVRVCR